ncbi:hypothetical protein [Candidatus Ruthturnera calyptogenae]|uniref:hypothetical protein n=1 Tax=Candidatus Ruthturnera calyptogenae TaxID=386487 RepID=UPI000464E3E8|nr:hypothetical protein [Candidatus Ruthturnera calyptogenae]
MGVKIIDKSGNVSVMSDLKNFSDTKYSFSMMTNTTYEAQNIKIHQTDKTYPLLIRQVALQ